MDAVSARTVWIVGAGASVSATNNVFPTLLGLPARAADLDLVDATGKKYAALERYLLAHHFGSLTDRRNPPNLETVLTLLETDVAVAAKPQFVAAHAEAISLLRRTMVGLHQQVEEAMKAVHEYRRMAEMLGRHDSVVTFNWDTLLDDALGRRTMLPDGTGELNWPSEDNACSRFVRRATGWGASTIDALGMRPPSSRRHVGGELIKAHGSIDWFACTNPSCRQHGVVFPVGRFGRSPRCQVCFENMPVVIVPPTLNKRIRELPALRRSWSLAAYELRRATRVVIWGYSLPPTDFFSEWLLRQVRTANCTEVVLINPDVVGGSKTKPRLNQPFVRRFISTVWSSKRKTRWRLFREFREFDEGRDLAIVEPSLRAEIAALG